MLLVLSSYPFTRFHNYNYEIENLRKKFKCILEIHDLSQIYFDNSIKNIFLTKKEKTRKFFSILQWAKRINTLLKLNKNKIIVINLLENNNLKSIFINFILKSKKVKILRFSSPGVSLSTDTNDSNLEKNNFERIKYVLKNLKLLSFYISSKFFNYINNFYNKNETKIISGAFYKNKFSSEKNKICSHSLDYSKFINKKYTNKKKNLIVYLDKAAPYFNDDGDYFGYRKEFNDFQSIKKYYYKLNLFLKNLEKLFFAKIIIIPHSKVKGRINPNYEKKFKVDHSLDALNKLISKCSFVVSPTPTTAVSYAIAYYKPIIFTYTNNENKYLSPFRNKIFMSKILGASLINMNKKIYKKDILKPVSKKKYDSYKYKYLTSKEIINKKNCEIILEYLIKKKLF